MKKPSPGNFCGTTPFMLGADKPPNIQNEMPSELRSRADIRAMPCLGLCNDTKLAGAPYVKLNGEIIEKATPEKIYEKMRALIAAWE